MRKYSLQYFPQIVWIGPDNRVVRAIRGSQATELLTEQYLSSNGRTNNRNQ